MYGFNQPNKIAYPFESKLQTIFNGVNLDEKIAGYKTLAVYGRELAQKEILYLTETYMEFDNRYIDSNYMEREITVRYEIQANTIKEFREIFEQLNFYLSKPNSKVTFTDDREFYYTCTLGAIEMIDINSLRLQSSFSLIAINPFKRSVESEILSFDKRGKMKKVTLYPVELENIMIRFKEPTDKLILRNETTGKRIILDNSFISGEKILINFKDGKIIGRGNKDYMEYLELTSNWEDFEISYNDLISSNANTNIQIEYREVRL